MTTPAHIKSEAFGTMNTSRSSNGAVKPVPKSVLRAVREKCLDCSGGNQNEVKLCPANTCPIHPFRFGKNPFRAKVVMSDERKAKLAAQLARGRAIQQKGGE